MNKRWLFALVLPPLLIGLVLRNVMSWRPQRIASFNRTPLDISVSPDGEWLLAEDAPSLDPLPTWFAPRLINIRTGQSRPLTTKQGPLLFSRWTSNSLLAEEPHSSINGSQNILLRNPTTLRVEATFMLKRGEELLSWSESKGDVWILTRRKWLHFNAHTGKLLQARTFKANSSQPGWKVASANISPDGQKAIVRFIDAQQNTLRSTQLWNLNLGKPTRRRMGVFPTVWIGESSYLDGDGLQRAINDDFPGHRLIDSNHTIWYRIQQKQLAIITYRNVKWFDIAANKFIEETRVPTLDFHSLNFSPDHARGYFVTEGGQIWSQRLK